MCHRVRCIILFHLDVLDSEQAYQFREGHQVLCDVCSQKDAPFGAASGGLLRPWAVNDRFAATARAVPATELPVRCRSRLSLRQVSGRPGVKRF